MTESGGGVAGGGVITSEGAAKGGARVGGGDERRRGEVKLTKLSGGAIGETGEEAEEVTNYFTQVKNKSLKLIG